MAVHLIAEFTPSLQCCKELQYNLHLHQKPPFDVPNPLILSTILQDMSNNIVVPVGTDANSHCDKDNLHNFHARYVAYIEQDHGQFPEQVEHMSQLFLDLFRMYHDHASNMFTVNPLLSAATYIQNNQTELPAMAYHGNLSMQRSNGVRDDVRCVGHLGNSFPGCACIREGKGMLNTYNSMPTAVHVM